MTLDTSGGTTAEHVSPRGGDAERGTRASVRVRSILAVAILYVVSARLGLELAPPPGKATAVFPASGVALAALLLGGPGVWPGVWLGSFGANVLLHLSNGTSHGWPVALTVAAVIGAGATAEAAVGRGILVRLDAARATFDTTRSVLAFTLLAAPLGALVSAVTGIGVLAVAGVVGWSAAARHALTWWLGDLTGVLVFTPALVAWALPHRTGDAEVSRGEWALHAVAVALASWIAFGTVNAHDLPLAFVCLPVLVLVTLRTGLRGASLTVLGNSMAALWSTMRHHGPFGGVGLSLFPSLMLMQGYAAAVAFSSLVLASTVREWRVAVVGLQAARTDLERRVDARTAQLQYAVDQVVRAQQKLALHVQQTPLGVIEWDLDFRVTAWNPAAERIFGWPHADAVGLHALAFVPEAARPHVAEVWEELIANRGGTRSTNPNLTRDGRTISCEWYNTPLVDASERVVGVASLVADVTDRVEAEAERDRLLVAYREAIATRDEFLSVASHELRTPLTSLRLAVQALLRETPGRERLDEATQQMLGAVGRQTNRLALLVNDLLDVSRVREGRLRLDVAEHDVAALVRDTVASLQGDLAVSGSTVTVDADRPVTARVDAARLGQIVTNLCTNAIKYGAGKPIHVQVEDAGDEVLVSVADGGIGIGAADQQRVFERYARAVSSRHFSGFGLGLHIVRVLTEAHGGCIELVSAPGEGSTFTVRLPRDGPREEAEPAPELPA